MLDHRPVHAKARRDLAGGRRQLRRRRLARGRRRVGLRRGRSPRQAVTAARVSSAIFRYVVSLPPVIVTRPSSDTTTRWRRERSAVRSLSTLDRPGAEASSGRRPAQVAVTSLRSDGRAHRGVDRTEDVARRPPRSPVGRRAAPRSRCLSCRGRCDRPTGRRRSNGDRRGTGMTAAMSQGSFERATTPGESPWPAAATERPPVGSSALDLVGPHPGGVHHYPCPYLGAVGENAPVIRPAAFSRETGDRRVVDGCGTVLEDCGAHDGEGQPGVVCSSVVVEKPATTRSLLNVGRCAASRPRSSSCAACRSSSPRRGRNPIALPRKP